MRRIIQPGNLPLWARVSDAVVCALAALLTAVIYLGGFKVAVAGERLLSVTSPWRILFWAVLIGVVRHALVRDRPLPRRIFSVRAAYMAVVALFLLAMGRSYQPQTGFTHLIQFGGQFDEWVLPAVKAVPHFVHWNSSGYDGQFYAQLAVDPLLRDPALAVAIDAPSFRARRILFSWSAYLLGLGRPAWILQAFAVQNVLCWLVMAWVLLRWFQPGTLRAFAGWFACLFASGFIISIRGALTDGPSMLLITAAIGALERGRHWSAVGLLGLSGLGRETNMLAATMIVPPPPWPRQTLIRIVASGFIVVLPLVLWSLYVYSVFHAYDAGSRAFSSPLVSYAATWQTTIAELSVNWRGLARYNFYVLVSLTVETLYLVWRFNWRNPWWRVGATYALLMTVLGPAVWEGDSGAVSRVLLPLTVAFNVLLARDRWFWPIFVLGNLSVLHGLATIAELPASGWL